MICNHSKEKMIMFDEKNISKLYRYEALLQAIDFFTQKFSLEQLASYAFEFANEILTLNSSVLFLKEGNSFRLINVRNYKIKEHFIPNTPDLQRIATLYGDVLKSGFDYYFNPEDIKLFNARLIIPLIIQDLLYGFIISDGKAIDDFDDDDIIMSRALMRLINNSLENSKNFDDLQKSNKQLDQKIFNLFSINQSSRILLSVLDMSKLYSLSIDIFSELTSSKVTTFGVYDEIRDKIVVRGYRNVFSSDKYYREFELKSDSYTGYKVVFNYEKDREELQGIFVDCDEFAKLEAEYIILLVKDRILGFVTISKPINERSYDESLFELIESLASSTYISLSNAMLFQEVKRQKQIAEQKYNVLVKLNKLSKNLKDCTDLDELSDLAIKTLSIGFGIKKAFIALLQDDEYVIKNYIGFEPAENTVAVNDRLLELYYSGVYFRYTADPDTDFFSKAFTAQIGESNCLVISPMITDYSSIEEEPKPIGFIAVLQTSETLREEEVLLIDTISNNIAPIVNSMITVRQIKNDYMVNVRELFIKRLKKYLSNRESFHIDFNVYYRVIPKKPFEEADLSDFEGMEKYYFDGMLLVLSELPLDAGRFDGCIRPESVEEVIDTIKKLP